MGKEKMKIAMICHFSNKEVREHLPFGKRRVYKLLCRLLGKSSKPQCADFAIWDTYIINSLKQRDDVELHVISACLGTGKKLCEFEIGTVKYYFFDASFSVFLKHLLQIPQLWHFFNPTRSVVHKLIKKINPDIIALIGAENPHYSDTVLGLKGYPIIVKAQTIYNNPERKSKGGGWNNINAYIERRIFKENIYFSVSTSMHQKLFREYKPSAYNLKMSWCAVYPEINTDVTKEYDFVNFANNMIDSKGFPDSIKALQIVKRQYPNVKLNLEGGYTEETLKSLMALAKECGVDDNITFTPYFLNVEDVYKNIVKSKFALLPCKLDFISSTMSQSMYYGLPIVCYETEGTPTLNTGEERVLIAEQGNVDDLASKMLKLLNDSELGHRLSKAAKEYIENKNNQYIITNEMLASFSAVIDHFNGVKQISEEVLYPNR